MRWRCDAAKKGLASESDKVPRSFRAASSSKEMEEMSSGGFMWRATNMAVACLLAASQFSQQEVTGCAAALFPQQSAGGHFRSIGIKLLRHQKKAGKKAGTGWASGPGGPARMPPARPINLRIKIKKLPFYFCCCWFRWPCAAAGAPLRAPPFC